MRKNIYRQFKKVIERYHLINVNDRIAVEVSTDRNSVVLLDCIMEYQKELDGAFDLKFFVVQQGNELANGTKEILAQYKINEYTVISENRSEEVYEIIGQNGCTKVALPHNYNEILNCTFMTMMQRKEVAQIHPKRESNQAKNLQFIRPICTVEDKVIEKWMKSQKIDFIEEATLFSKLAFIEEKVVMPERNVNNQFQFNIYERI